MFNNYKIAIAMRPTGELDDTAEAGRDGITQSGLYVESGMKARSACKGITPITKATA